MDYSLFCSVSPSFHGVAGQEGQLSLWSCDDGTGWQVVGTLGTFDPASLDPALLMQAFGAGFFVVALFLVGSFGLREVLRFIRSL